MSTHFRRMPLVAVVTIIALTLIVAGCGKKGAPERPLGSDFPRQYPNPNPRGASNPESSATPNSDPQP